jgi:hypothetical protein
MHASPSLSWGRAACRLPRHAASSRARPLASPMSAPRARRSMVGECWPTSGAGSASTFSAAHGTATAESARSAAQESLPMHSDRLQPEQLTNSPEAASSRRVPLPRQPLKSAQAVVLVQTAARRCRVERSTSLASDAARSRSAALASSASRKAPPSFPSLRAGESATAHSFPMQEVAGPPAWKALPLPPSAVQDEVSLALDREIDELVVEVQLPVDREQHGDL